jgi:hypothetical protein
MQEKCYKNKKRNTLTALQLFVFTVEKISGREKQQLQEEVPVFFSLALRGAPY